MNYTEVAFTVTPYSEDIADALVSELGNIGYDAFSNTDNGFMAYIPAKDFSEQAIRELEIIPFLRPRFAIAWTHSEIADQNWNKTWEDNFTPILVDNRILVRAGHHPTVEGIQYEIIIEPQMSFGTGHHATTCLMLRFILEYTHHIKGKEVLDMGCGTAILSIMAAKVGASHVTGIDIDEWAYNNAMENIGKNNTPNATIRIGDANLLAEGKMYDCILANINRNILLQDMHRYIACLNPGGHLIMSGFYDIDLALIRAEAEKNGLEYRETKQNDQWTAVSFHKK